ncbi:hypothetical protein [Sphingomonas oligophenolica]|uniref:hypothetical protein n=1 Tax=Sphingomonas oligophenolica TaxID=301154 RepID=UPI0031F51F38
MTIRRRQYPSSACGGAHFGRTIGIGLSPPVADENFPAPNTTGTTRMASEQK